MILHPPIDHPTFSWTGLNVWFVSALALQLFRIVTFPDVQHHGCLRHNYILLTKPGLQSLQSVRHVALVYVWVQYYIAYKFPRRLGPYPTARPDL